MKELLTRSLTGIIYVAILVLSLTFHPLFFALLLVLFNFQGLREFRIMNTETAPTAWGWIMLNTLLLSVSLVLAYLGLPLEIKFIPLLLLPFLLFTGSLYVAPWKSMGFTWSAILASIYITLPLALLFFIHLKPLEAPVVLILFVFIWVNDSFAYLFGMWLGKHRLFERISPKKSWEGFIGGLVATLAASYLAYHYYPVFNQLTWFFMALVTVISAVFGDLFESMLKRSANVKDSGSLLPGHGGVLDRIDSLLFVSPVIYCYLLFT